MKNIYMAVGIEENNKNYAYVLKTTTNDNIAGVLDAKRIKYAHFCETKKKAREIIEAWNDGYKNNGRYMF